MEIVRTKDSGTLQYEIFFDEDESEAVVFGGRSPSDEERLAASSRRSAGNAEREDERAARKG